MTDVKMTLEKFLARRQPPVLLERRPSCDQCWKALVTCYCHLLRPFTSPISFVILQHPEEYRNPIATARMAQLSMTNSVMIGGRNFEGNPKVEALLRTPGRRNVILYPRSDAQPLDDVLEEANEPNAEPLVLWVIDSKWTHVNKMMRYSPTVRQLPATAFVPAAPSRFTVREQPRPSYVSTVEAIHAVLIRRAALAGDGDVRHESMIEIFRYLVSQQLGFADRDDDTRHSESKRKRREKRARLGLEPNPW